jgi:hypothetical protein
VRKARDLGTKMAVTKASFKAEGVRMGGKSSPFLVAKRDQNYGHGYSSFVRIRAPPNPGRLLYRGFVQQYVSQVVLSVTGYHVYDMSSSSSGSSEPTGQPTEITAAGAQVNNITIN